MQLFYFLCVVGLVSIVTSELVRYPIHGGPRRFHKRSFSGTVRRPALILRTDVPLVNDPQQAVWNYAVCKGVSLLADMASDDEKAGSRYVPPRDSAESPFQEFSKLCGVLQRSVAIILTLPLKGDLTKWGYGFLAYDDYYDLDKSLPIKSALIGLGVDVRTNKEGGNNRAIWW
jgi:hypothetical protein